MKFDRYNDFHKHYNFSIQSEYLSTDSLEWINKQEFTEVDDGCIVAAATAEAAEAPGYEREVPYSPRVEISAEAGAAYTEPACSFRRDFLAGDETCP